MRSRTTKLERIILSEFRKALTKLHLENGDFIVVKDAATMEAIGGILSRWKPHENGFPDVAFIFAPEGIDKVPREDLEKALAGSSRIILAE